MRIWNLPAAEHVQPKVHHDALERSWCNLLLSCGYCNPTKGAADVGRDECLWPDTDNTARAYSYSEAGVHVNDELPPDLHRRATRTWRLVGLDKRPAGEREPSAADPRFRRRQEVWGVATMAREQLLTARADGRGTEVAWCVVALARESGFWSVWMTVFADDREMRARFLQAFEGTATCCFDAETRPVRRPGGLV
jgi:hypothetical protein